MKLFDKVRLKVDNVEKYITLEIHTSLLDALPKDETSLVSAWYVCDETLHDCWGLSLDNEWRYRTFCINSCSDAFITEEKALRFKNQVITLFSLLLDEEPNQGVPNYFSC
jgi:hypothetical protein